MIERFALVIGPAAEAIVAREEAAECGPVALCDCGDLTDSAGLRRRFGELAKDPEWRTITVVFQNVSAVLHDADAVGLFLGFGRSRERTLAVRPVLRLLDRVLAGPHRTISLSRRELHLLSVLALSGAPVKARRLTELLWPGAPARLACGSLRVYVSRLRKRFAPEPVIELTATGYRLAPGIGFDLADVEEDLAAMETRAALNRTERAYVTELERKARRGLDEAFDSFAASLQQMLYRIAVLLTWDDLRAARFGIATERARVLVAENPFDENARRLLNAAMAAGIPAAMTAAGPEKFVRRPRRLTRGGATR